MYIPEVLLSACNSPENPKLSLRVLIVSKFRNPTYIIHIVFINANTTDPSYFMGRKDTKLQN